MMAVIRYQQHMENARVVSDISCAMDESFRMLWNLLMQREADYALCIMHDNFMTDKAQLKVLQMQCKHLFLKKRSVPNKSNRWEKMDDMKKKCYKYCGCCPVAIQCQRITSQSEYTSLIIQKHLEINQKISECHIRLKHLLSGNFRHKNKLSSKHMEDTAASSIYYIAIDDEKDFDNITKFSDKAIKHEGIYRIGSRDESERTLRESNDKTNLKMQYGFLKSVIAKLVKKLDLSINTNTERQYSGLEAINMREQRAIESLLNYYLLELFNCGNITSLSRSQDVNEDFMNNYNSTVQIPKSSHTKHKEMEIYQNPFIVDAPNETSRIAESWKARNGNAAARVAGNTIWMWTSTIQNINSDTLDAFFSKDYLKVRGNEPIEVDASVFDKYEEDIDSIDDETELKSSIIAVEGNNIHNDPLFFTDVPLKVSIPLKQTSLKTNINTPTQISQKTVGESKRKLISFDDPLKNFERYHFKFYPKAFPISSPVGEIVISTKYPSHFFTKNQKIMTEIIPGDIRSQAENRRWNFSPPFHKSNEKDFFRNISPDDAKTLHNSIISSNNFFVKSLRRTDKKSSISSWEEFSPNNWINAVQNASKAKKNFMKSKTPKHNIAKFVIAERKRFSKKNYREIESDEKWETSMLTGDKFQQNIEMFNKYGKEKNNGNDRANRIWAVIPTVTNFALKKESKKSDLKKLRKINIGLREKRSKEYKIGNKNQYIDHLENSPLRIEQIRTNKSKISKKQFKK